MSKMKDMDPNVKEILEIAKRLKLTKDDLIMESECVSEYGEYYHMSLMGFSSSQLWDAAQILEGAA